MDKKDASENSFEILWFLKTKIVVPERIFGLPIQYLLEISTN